MAIYLLFENLLIIKDVTCEEASLADVIYREQSFKIKLKRTRLQLGGEFYIGNNFDSI